MPPLRGTAVSQPRSIPDVRTRRPFIPTRAACLSIGWLALALVSLGPVVPAAVLGALDFSVANLRGLEDTMPFPNDMDTLCLANS